MSFLISYYTNTENWKNGIPMPPYLEAKAHGIPIPLDSEIRAKKDWAELSTDKKIHLILEDVKQERATVSADQAGAASDVIAAKCWEEAKKCETGAKIVTIAEECFQCSKKLKEQELKQKIIIKCHDGDLEIPQYLMGPLAEKSFFFRHLFSGFFKKADKEYEYTLEKNINKKDLNAIIEIWLGKQKITENQTAYDLLPDAQWINLAPDPINEALVETIKNWSITDSEDIEAACDFAHELTSQHYNAPEVQTAVQEYLVRVYQALVFSSYAQKTVESICSLLSNLEKNVLDSLKQLNVTTLCLDRTQVNNRVIVRMIEDFPQITSLTFSKKNKDDFSFLSFDYSLLTTFKELKNLDLSASNILPHDLEKLVKLPNLESINLSGCNNLKHLSPKEGRKSLQEILAQAPHLKNIKVSGCEAALSGDKWESLSDRLETLYVDSGRKLNEDFLYTQDFFDSIDLTNLAPLTHLIFLSMEKYSDLWVSGSFPQLDRLEELNVSYCSLADYDLSKLIKMAPNLKTLKLNKNPKERGISDQGLKALAELKSLISLEIEGYQLTKETLKVISALPNLKTLNGKPINREPVEKFREDLLETVNSWSAADPKDIETACEFAHQLMTQNDSLPQVSPALQDYLLRAYQTILFTNSSSDLEKKVLDSLQQFNITALCLDRKQVNHQVMEKMIKTFPHITSLTFSQSSSREKSYTIAFDFLLLTELKNLKNLDLSNSSIYQLQVKELVKLPNLETINLSNCRYLHRFSHTRGGISLQGMLGQAPKLTSINISGCRETLSSDKWGQLPNQLEELYADDEELSDHLNTLAPLIHLKVLSMKRSPSVWAEVIPPLTQLQELHTCSVWNETLSQIPRWAPNLETLHLNAYMAGRVGPAGLQALAELQNLTSLEITNAEITQEMLEAIISFSNLKTFNGKPIEKFRNNLDKYIGMRKNAT